MTLRAVAASFNAIAMVALATTLTGGSFADPRAVLLVWAPAAAAVVAALAVLVDAAALGWVAIGCILGAALVGEPPRPLLILLALAFMPLLRRPRGSLLTGVGLSVVSAVLFRDLLVRML